MSPYRLQPLLELRERAKESAELALSAALGALEKEKAEQRRLAVELERCRHERRQRATARLEAVVDKGARASDLLAMNCYEQRLQDEEARLALGLERQRRAVESAEQEAEQRRRELERTAKELEAIEKHREDWSRHVQAERRMREELSQDELGQAMFRMRHRR